MSTLFGEGSLVKKIITWISAIVLILPIVAYSTVEVAQAAQYNNIGNVKDVDPSVPLKTTTRNPDNIVGLSMTEKKGVPIMRMNISASNHDVIKKGDKLDITFNKKNVDTSKIKELASQDNNSLYDITKKGNDLVVNFKKDATSGNYQEVFAIATKNVKADTKASASFAGKSIKIDNNNINSTYRAPQKQQQTNQPQKVANNSNSNSQQSTNGAQQASTQSASSNDGESQATTSNGQTSQQVQQNQATQNGGTTTQQQANQSDSQNVNPSFSQAEDAVNTRTTIQVTGTATSDPTANESQEASNAVAASNGTQTTATNSSTTTAATTTTPATTETQTSANVASDAQATQSETTQQPAAATTTTPAATVAPSQTTTYENNSATTSTQPTTNVPTTTTTQVVAQSTFEPQEVTAPATQASDDSGYIEIANQGYVSPKTTLDNYLTSDQDLDNTENASDEDNYEDNSQFEAIYGHVQQKAQDATTEEVNEITKDLPSMWNYIGKNDSDSDTQGQVWRFHSVLSTGRDLFVTIDGTAQPDSTDALQQQMPKLLRAMGSSIEPGALNEAVDIDALKRSDIYQDYVDGKYAGPNADNSASTADAVASLLKHTTISLEKPTNGADITQLPDVAKVDPTTLLNLAKENAQNSDQTNSTTSNDADSQAVYDAIKQDTYSKMTPWASDDEKAEMLKSVPSIWNDASSKTTKDDKVGQFYNYVLNTSDGRPVYYTIDGRVIPNGNKYEQQLPNIIISLGKNMTSGEFDPSVNNDILKNSQAYKDYTSQQNGQGNAATTAATTAATAAPAAAGGLGGLGLLPMLLPVLGAPLLLGGLLLGLPATGLALATLPVALTLGLPVALPAILGAPIALSLPIVLPALAIGVPLLLGAKLLSLPIKLLNNLLLSTVGAVLLTAPITLFNTVVGVGLGLVNTLIGSIPLAIFDFVAPLVVNFLIIRAVSHLVQLTLFNVLLFSTLAKALINGAIDLALALSFIGLPIALLKGLFDLAKLGLGLFNAFLLPVLAGIGTFLLLAPLALFNTIALTLFNSSIPLLLGFLTALLLSNLVSALTFFTLLGIKLFNDLLRNGFQLLIRLLAAGTILVGLPLLIIAAQVLNFFLLLVATAVGGLILWNLLTLAKTLMLAGLGIALFSLPLAGQFLINTIVKWSIRALIHIFRFFLGLFKVGARLVLSFVLGLLNAIAGVAKAASVITAVVSGIAAALTALIPVVGPVLALLPLLISLLSIANALILTPIKLVLGLLNLLVLGLNLLALPVYLFIRPLVTIGLALGAGSLSDILMPILTLPLVLFNQLTLFNLVFLPLLLLNLLNTFLIEPIVLAGLGLLNALALPFIFALSALGLVALLGLLLLSIRLPLIALALLALPSFIPFFNLIMDTIFLAPLVTMVLSVLNLFIGLPLMMLIDTIIDLTVPFLVFLAGLLLLAPVFGPLAFLNPLTWINLPLVTLIGTYLTKLALKLISLPVIFFFNGLISLIPAAIVAFFVGLLRALFGGLPFMLLAPLFLLPIVLNGFLTALVPGLNLFTVPAALIAGLIGLPLALAGLLNNVLGRLIWRVLSFVTAYLASNVLKDLLALIGVPLTINLLTPLIFINKFLTTQFLIFPALWLGLPLLAQLLTSGLLWGITFIKGFAQVALDLFNIGATLLTLPLWTILPGLNLLRRLALAFVAFVSLPLRLLKNILHFVRAIVEIGAILALPLLVGLPAFLLLLPITTFNFFALKLLNVLIPLLLSLFNALALSLIVAGITFIALLAIHLLNKFLSLAAKLLALGAITLLILGALPILLGAALLNFLLLAGLNAFIGFNAWLITTLINNLLIGALLLGLALLPLVSQLIINTVVKWTIRAVVHLIRFFVGLFRLGARLVLQFIIGLTNLVLGVAKAISVVAAVTNLLLAPISLLVPVVGPILFLLHLLRAGLAGINFLILLPLKLLAGLINFLTLGGLLLSIPYWLFIRPLTSVLLAIGAGIISDIVMTLLTLPLVLFNTLTLFNLVGIPALLLKAFNNLVVLPLLINGIGLLLALGLPLALLLGALGLLNLLALGLLGLNFPLIALILLSLPNLIPFLDLIMVAMNLIGLASLLLNGLKLLLLPIKILGDLFNDFLIPALVAGLTFLLLLPLLGVITFLNPLRWLNLGILSAIGTFLAKLLLGLLAIPFILVKNLLTSLIPAVLAGLLVGLLRALFGGLPFLLLALGLLLPLILNGLLTALIPGLNLLTVPLGLLALLAGLPLVTLGILNNLLKQLVWTVLGTILTQLALNLAKDLLDLLLWLPLQLLLALPLFLLNLALNALLLRPLLLFGLPLLAALLTQIALTLFNLIRRGLELIAELLTLGATLLTLPLWTILPGLNFLRKLLRLAILLTLPLRVLKALFDVLRAAVEIGFILLIPLLVGLPAFLLLLPITTFNFFALKLLNVLIPLLLSLFNALALSLIVAGITFIALLAIHLLNKFLSLAAKLLALGAITLLILGALPILLGAALLNFLLLAGLNAFIGFNAWLITTLINNLLIGALLLGLALLPLVSQLIINTVVKWTIRAVVHLIRFFVGLFRLGARLVLQFIIGLTNLVLGVAKAISVVAAVTNLLLAPISLLVPVVGPILFLLHLLRAGLAGINFLILLPLKLLAGLINFLTLGGLLLSIPYWLFIRPLTSVLLAIGAGIISDIVMTLLTLPLVLFNTLTLFNLVGIPALLLKAFNNLVVLPLLINGIGLLLALGLPLALLLGALGLLNLLALGLLGLNFPLIALILLSLPNLIPFLDLIMVAMNLIGLASLLLNGLKLLLLPIKILGDLFNDFLIPALVAGLTFLLLLPLLGVITFLNPLRWLNLGILSAIGTFLAKLLLGLLAIPFILVKNLLTSLIPAVLAGLLVGLLRALFGGLPFLLLALGLLLPLILNGLLTALIPGLNLLTVPLGLLALLAGLPLVTLGILNNLLKQLVWTVLGTILTQLALNLAKDLLDLLLWLPLQLLLALPLFLLNLALNALLLRPLLLFGLPLLAALLTQIALTLFNLIRRGLELIAELLTLGATLLTSPLWKILPGINFLRRLLKTAMIFRILRNILVGLLKMGILIGLPLLNGLFAIPLALFNAVVAFILTKLFFAVLAVILGAVFTAIEMLLLKALLLPLILLNSALLALIPSLLNGLIVGLLRLFFGGLPFFTLARLFVIVPMILIGLLTALIPGLNLLTLPLGLLALLVLLPLSILGTIWNILISLLAGNWARLISKLLLNAFNDIAAVELALAGLPILLLLAPIIPLVLLIPALIIMLGSLPFILLSMLLLLPISLPILIFNLLLILPVLVFGLPQLYTLLWFFGSAFLVLTTDPLEDLKAFIVLMYTMVTEPVLYWAFNLIMIPMTIGTFIGSFTNWLNPLNWLNKAITAFALFAAPIASLLALLNIDLLRFGILLTSIPLLSIPAFIVLTIAKRLMLLLSGIFFLNSFIASAPVVIEPWVALLIIFIDDLVGGILSLGISVPDVLLTWGMLVPAVAFPVFFAVGGVGLMLSLDSIAVALLLPIITIVLNIGLVLSAIANPITALIAINLFATIGLASIVAGLAGAFMLAYVWMPFAFNLLPFLQYLIFANPAFYAIIEGSLVPAIGAIGLIIGGVIYWILGNFGSGMLTATSFGIFVHLLFPLVLNVVFGIAELLSVLPVLLLVLPLALIQSTILLGLINLPIIIFNILNVLPVLVIGVPALISIFWLFGSVFLQLLTNPVEDIKAFFVLLYTMVEEPVFYWAWNYITIPMTIATFVGMFTNWVNPFNWLNKAISAVPLLGIPLVLIGLLLTIDILRVISLVATIPLLNIPTLILLTIAKLTTLTFLTLLVLNSFVATVPVVLEPWAALVIIFIDDLVGGILSLGISVPDVLLTWGMMIMAVVAPILFAVQGLNAMLSLDIIAALILMPIVAVSLNLGLLSMAFTHPFAVIIAINNLAAMGITSLVLLVLGIFMLAYTWLPITFNDLAFLQFFIFGNPGFYAIIMGSLVPAIGAIGLIIAGVLFWIFGNFGSGLITANSFALFVHVMFPLVFSMLIGVAALASVLPVLLVALPAALIKTLLFFALINIPIILFNLLILIPVALIGTASLITIFWFFGSAFFQLLTNPLEDLKTFIVLLYTMVTEPVFYWAFNLITVPMTISSFIGTFVNWLNPFNWLNLAITSFVILGLPITDLLIILNVDILRFAILFTSLPIFSIPAFFVLGLAKKELLLMFVLYFLNSFVASVPVVLEPWVALLIIFIDDLVGGILSLGISVPDVLVTWVMLIPAITFPVIFAVVGVGLMLSLDAFVTALAYPILITTLNIGLVLSVLSNPLVALLGINAFATIGLVSIVLGVLGIFMLAYTWMPASFNLLAFLQYLIFANPGFYAIIEGSLVPAIGAIGLIIGGVIYWIFGNFGSGLITANSFALFVHTMFPLVLNTLLGVAELLSILPVLLLALPVALIQAALLLGLFALPVVIFNVLNLLPALIVGLSSLIIINWFFGSVAFQLLTNPIEDLKTFIVLLYTMVTEPVFYWAFIWITLPMTIGAFLGAFVNWLNPLNWIFKAISAFTIIGIPITVLLSILDIDIIRVLALLTTLPIVGIPVAALLGIAKLLLLNLINIYFLNSFIASLPVVIEPWVALLIIFIDDLVGGILSLGISVPDILLTWGMLIPAIAFPVLFVVLGLTIMLSLDAVVTLLAIPLIAPLINISLLILALGFNPLLALIGVNLFTTIGITSIVLAIAGLFTLAYTWMPFSFNALAFLVYFIFVNPGFYAIIQGSLVPAIGAIGLIIGGVLHWIIGNFGTGLITANSFAIFAHVAFTAVLSLAIGVIELISVLPVALIALPLAIIQSLLLLGLFALPVVLFNLAIFLPALIIGAAGMLAAFWFFGSAFFQLLTNPIQDLKALVVLVYTMITEPIFYWGFQFITIPMTFGAFIGTFLNWVNPLNYIFKAISAFAILGTPIVELNSFLALELLRFGSLLTLLPIFGIPAFLGLTIAKRMLVRLLVLFVLNTFLATVPVVLEPWVALLIIVIDDVVGGILSLGISVPDILLTWGMLIPAIAFPVLFAVQGVGIMLGFDIIDILIFAPLILIPMIFGLFNAILANPLLAIITKLFFDFQGIVSIGLLLAGIFTLSYIWLPMTFNGLAFAIYFIFGNPGFYAIIQGSLVPAIGAIGLIIAGILHWVIGNFGTGLVTANSFALFVHLMFPLVLTTVIGILELVSSLALSIFAPLLPLIALGVLGLVVLPLVLSIYAAFKAFQTLLILISLAPFLIPLVGLTLGLLAPIFPLLLLILIPLQLLFDVGVWLLFRGLNNLLSLLNGLIKQIVVNTIGSFIPTLLMKLALLNSLMLHLFAGLMNLIPGLLHKLFTIPLWLLSGLRFLTSLLTVPVLLLDMLNNFIASLVWNFITSLASFLIKNLIWIKLFKLLNKLVGLLLRPILLLFNIALPLLALPIIKFNKALRNAIIAGLLSFLIPFIGAKLIIPTVILDGLRFIIDDVILGLLLLPGLIPFVNLLLDALFFIPLLLNLISLFNLLRTPLKWIHDLFWQLALPLAVLALTFAILIPFFGLISLLNPFKWLGMALLSALTTFNVQLLTTLIVLPLKLLNNKLLSLLPALLNGLLLGFLRNILGGLPLDVLGLLALPLLNILGLIGTLTPGLRLLGLPLLLLTQLLGLPLLLDSLRNLIAPLLWGLLAGLLTYPLVKLAKNVIDIALLPLLGLLSTLPIFLLKLFNKAFVLRPLLLFGLPLLAQLLTGLALPLFNLIRRAIKLGLNLLKGAIALLTMPLWLGLPALNLLREALILPVLLLTLLRGLRNIFRLLGFPLLLLALPLLAGLATLLLGLPLITLLNKLLSMPLLALLLPLLAALPILPIKILLDLLLLPLVLLGNKLLGLPAALLAGLLLPLLLGRMIRHLIKLPLDLLKLAGLVLFNLLLPFIPFLNLLTPLLWPLGLLLQPLALADVLRDLLGNLPFDLLNLLLILPLAQILSTLAMLIPGLGLLLIPFLLPLKLFNRFIAIPLALVRTLGDLAKALLLGLPLALLGTLLAFPLINLLNDILSLALLPLLTGLLTLPLFLLNLGLLTLLTFPIAKGVLPFLIANGLSALVANFLPVLAGLLLNPVIVLANGIRLFNDFVFGLLHLGAFLLLTLPGLIPFRNLLLNALFFIPLLLNLISLFNLLRTPLKWILDLFNQLALPLAAMALTFAILIPFFGLISLLTPFKWLRMALLSALTTFNVQLLSTLFLLPLKLLNNKLLSLLPALLNGLLLGFLRNILGGLPLDILGLLALPLLNLMSLLGLLVPGLRLLSLPLLLLTQLLGLPLLLDTLRNLIAPLLWGNLAGLLTYPIANLIKNVLNLLGLPLLGLLSTLPIFLLKLFNKAFVLRPLLLFGLPLLAQLLTGLALPLFNLIRRAIKLGLNLLKGAIALLTMPLWLGLPALNLLREALILPVLLLTLLRGLRNLFNTFLGLPGLLLALPLLAGLATLLLGLPLITLLNKLLSMPLLALLLPLLAALPILPIKILLDLLLLPLVLLGNKLLGLPAALLAGLLLPLLLGRMIRHLIKLPLDLLKLAGLVLFNLLLPFIPFLNLLTPLLWPLGLLLQPLALADVLRDLLGNLPFDLLNLLLILPLAQILSTLAMLIPGLGLLLIPFLLPLKLFNRFIAIPLALVRTLGDLAKALLLGLPLALLGTLLAFPLINLLNDILSLALLPLLTGLLTLPLFLLNLGLLTLLTFPIAKGVLPFLIANGLSALVANFLPVLAGLLLNPVIVLANGIRLLKDLIKTINKFILLGLLALPGLIPFRNLILNGLFLIPALINGLSLLNLLSLPFKFLRDLLKNNILPLLVAGLTNLLLLPIFGPLQFLNPINWILVPALAALRTFNTKLLAKLFLVPGLILLNLLTSLIPATLAAIVVPLLRSLLGGLPLDILGLLGLPLLNLAALIGSFIPGIRLLALPLLLLTQLLGLPLLLDTLRNLIAPLLWGNLAGLLTYPIANLVKDALALLGLPLLDLLTFLPRFGFKLLRNVLLGNLLHLGLPLLAQALTFLALVPLNLLRAGLKLLRNILPLALALLTMPLWFNLPLLNIIRRVAFWLLLGLELLTLPFKLLRNILRTFVGLPLLMLGLPLLAGLLNFLFILPLVTLASMLLALPLPLTLLLPLLALLGNLPIKLLTDLLLLPLMFLINGLLALPLAGILGNILPLVLGALNGLIKLPFDLLGLLGLPLLLGLLDLGKLIALFNPLLWPLLPILNILRNVLRMMIPFKLADFLKDILGPLSALPIDNLLALAIPALGLLTLLTMLNPIFWPLLPVLLPLALTLGLVGTPIALFRVLKDLLKLALPVLATMLLFPIIHTGMNILGLLALPLISGLLTLPLFLLNLGLKTLITLPIVKGLLPFLINLGIVLALANIPALIMLPVIVLRNLVKGLRLIGDALAILLALPGVLKDIFDLVILPLKILIKPLLVLGLPLIANVLTFLALTPLMLLNNLLAHLIKLPLLGLIGLGNALLPLLVPLLFMNMLVRPLITLGLMLLNGVILPGLLKLALAIPLIGLLALPFIISLLGLPLFLLSLPIPLFNMGLQLLSLGMIIPGLAMTIMGVVALPFGLSGLLGGGTGTPGTTVPGTPGTPGDNGNLVPEQPGINVLRRIPSVGFWVHNDPLVLSQY